MSTPIKDIIYDLNDQMLGNNYGVDLNVEILLNCHTLEECKLRIKELYPDSEADQVKPLRVSEPTFWEEINTAFDYRGDSSSGLHLNEQEERQLQAKQRECKDFFNLKYFSSPHFVFHYPGRKGLPGYIVMWAFAFIIVSEYHDSIFLFGSASD